MFSCYETLHDTIYFSELGSSAVILEAGYNIASLMLRYQGIDWRQKENWNCNERFSPYAEHHYDGLSLDPLEVVFVKVCAGSPANGLTKRVSCAHILLRQHLFELSPQAQVLT